MLRQTSITLILVHGATVSAAAQRPTSLNADPDSETMQLSIGSDLRVIVGMPLPVHRGNKLSITVAGAVEISDSGLANPFPSDYWRGLVRVSAERVFTGSAVGFHLAHESDHLTDHRDGDIEPFGANAPYLTLNSAGAHGRWRVRHGRTTTDLGGNLRIHVFTCNRREINCAVDISWPDALGFELDVSAAVAYRAHQVLALYASIYGTWLTGGRTVDTELRATARFGLVFPTEHGDWSTYLELAAGNEVGYLRQDRRVGIGAGARYTVPFAD